MTQKNILVTGGFGFLGTYLVERLLEEPETHVHVVDNLVTSPIDVDKFVARVNAPRRLTYDTISIEDYCLRGGPRMKFDEVYHLASVVGPVGVLEYAGQITRIITNDTYRVIDLVKADGARLCDVSTSEVYGGGRDGYCSENDAKIITPKISVRLEYAVAKLACEVTLMNMAKVGQIDVVIIRPFNIAGPRQSAKGGFVLPRFIAQALKGAPLTVYADGKMIRAFTHVTDVAEALVLATRKGTCGEAYNVGNPANKIAILELAQTVIRLCGSASKVEHVDPKQLFGALFEEANDKFPDSDRATSQLGWHPKHDLERVIIDSLEYFRAGRVD